MNDSRYDRLVKQGAQLAAQQADIEARRIPERRCPKCGNTDLHGVIVRGVYDGVLYWICPNDNTAVHRWEAIGINSRLHDAAQAYMEGAIS